MAALADITIGCGISKRPSRFGAGKRRDECLYDSYDYSHLDPFRTQDVVRLCGGAKMIRTDGDDFKEDSLCQPDLALWPVHALARKMYGAQRVGSFKRWCGTRRRAFGNNADNHAIPAYLIPHCPLGRNTAPRDKNCKLEVIANVRLNPLALRGTLFRLNLSDPDWYVKFESVVFEIMSSLLGISLPCFTETLMKDGVSLKCLYENKGMLAFKTPTFVEVAPSQNSPSSLNLFHTALRNVCNISPVEIPVRYSCYATQTTDEYKVFCQNVTKLFWNRASNLMWQGASYSSALFYATDCVRLEQEVISCANECVPTRYTNGFSEFCRVHGRNPKHVLKRFCRIFKTHLEETLRQEESKLMEFENLRETKRRKGIALAKQEEIASSEAENLEEDEAKGLSNVIQQLRSNIASIEQKLSDEVFFKEKLFHDSLQQRNESITSEMRMSFEGDCCSNVDDDESSSTVNSLRNKKPLQNISLTSRENEKNQQGGGDVFVSHPMEDGNQISALIKKPLIGLKSFGNAEEPEDATNETTAQDLLEGPLMPKSIKMGTASQESVKDDVLPSSFELGNFISEMISSVKPDDFALATRAAKSMLYKSKNDESKGEWASVLPTLTKEKEDPIARSNAVFTPTDNVKISKAIASALNSFPLRDVEEARQIASSMIRFRSDPDNAKIRDMSLFTEAPGKSFSSSSFSQQDVEKAKKTALSMFRAGPTGKDSINISDELKMADFMDESSITQKKTPDMPKSVKISNQGIGSSLVPNPEKPVSKLSELPTAILKKITRVIEDPILFQSKASFDTKQKKVVGDMTEAKSEKRRLRSKVLILYEKTKDDEVNTHFLYFDPISTKLTGLKTNGVQIFGETSRRVPPSVVFEMVDVSQGKLKIAKKQEDGTYSWKSVPVKTIFLFGKSRDVPDHREWVNGWIYPTKDERVVLEMLRGNV